MTFPDFHQKWFLPQKPLIFIKKPFSYVLPNVRACYICINHSVWSESSLCNNCLGQRRWMFFDDFYQKWCIFGIFRPNFLKILYSWSKFFFCSLYSNERGSFWHVCHNCWSSATEIIWHFVSADIEFWAYLGPQKCGTWQKFRKIFLLKKEKKLAPFDIKCKILPK